MKCNFFSYLQNENALEKVHLDEALVKNEAYLLIMPVNKKIDNAKTKHLHTLFRELQAAASS